MEGKVQTLETLEPSAGSQQRKIGEYLSRKLKVCLSGEIIPQYPIDVKVVATEHEECSLEENETNVETTQSKDACTSQKKPCMPKEIRIHEKDPIQFTKLEPVDDREEESDISVSETVSDNNCDAEEHPKHSELSFTHSSNSGCEGMEIRQRQYNLFSRQETQNLGNNAYSVPFDVYLKRYDFTYGYLDMDPEFPPPYNSDDIEVSASEDDFGSWEPAEQTSKNCTVSDTDTKSDHAEEPTSPSDSDDSDVSVCDDDLGCWEPVEEPCEVVCSGISGEDRRRRNLAYELLRNQRVIDTLPPRISNILHEIAGMDENSLEDGFPLHSFDAFISYTRRDQSWVMRELVQKLEYDHEPKIRLCLHQREWIAGRTIIRNIEDSIRHSRKTVLILSDEYLRSHYAGLEMSLAERLRPDEYATYYTSLQMLSGKLLVMLNHRTCLIWHGNNELTKRRFWQQLTEALQPPHNAIYNEDNRDFLMEVHKTRPIWSWMRDHNVGGIEPPLDDINTLEDECQDCIPSLRYRETGPYVFDAFISYAHQDMKWVVHQLLPRLEYEANIRLRLHQRNWIVGRTIARNAVDSFEQSQKSVLVLSNSFAKSSWAYLEMSIAQHKLQTSDRDSVVPIMIENISNMPDQMRLLLLTQDCLYWSKSDKNKQTEFWKELIKRLKQPRGQRVYSDNTRDFLMLNHIKPCD